MTTLRQWLDAEPFAFAMSSGFFGFFAHCGVLSALEEERLAPRRVAGSSAGALVGGAWAAGISADRLNRELLALRRSDFWDPWPGAGLLRGRRFRRKLEALLPVEHLEECAVPVTLSVHDVWKRKPQALDTGPLAQGIHASCAVPFLFHPVRIDGRSYVDGGVSDRPGILGVPHGQRLFLHHLASRSPWRRKSSTALQIPKRDNMVTLVLDGLPRAGPFRLEAGHRALRLAHDAMLRALDEPLTDTSVILSV